MVYRIKQFIWAATARLSNEDIIFINGYLDDYEKKLFSTLSTSTQAHSIKVSREVLKQCQEQELYDINLIKAALLHDIGQANTGLNTITKSIMVIADKLFPGKLRKLHRVGFVKAYYEHGEMAMDFLRMEPEYIRFLIKNHHNYEIHEDEKLKILQAADSKN